MKFASFQFPGGPSEPDQSWASLVVEFKHLRLFRVGLIGVGIGIGGSLIGIVDRGLFRVGPRLVYLFLDDWDDEGNVWKIVGL